MLFTEKVTTNTELLKLENNMRKVILLRYGEVFLKGKNRNVFENALLNNIKSAVFAVENNHNAEIKKIGGRYLLSGFEKQNLEALVDRLKKVFGLVSLSVAYEVETSVENIENVVKEFVKTNVGANVKTFKVDVKRADKSFPVNSIEFSAYIGGVVLNLLPNLKVDLHSPEFLLEIDIRENGRSYVFAGRETCCGGLPVGVSGNALVMLSGGIDSPVATYLVAKRGLKVSCVHFHSYPYTSKQAKDKVIKLAKEVKDYTGEFDLYCVSFTKIQEEIHKNCKDGYMITIMRRIMMRICEILCEKYGFNAIVTGENLGQVASQTVESLTSTESVLKNHIVIRPLITFDKLEIIDIAKNIGTFETSILPYEDCCTVFLPKNPLIKPKIELVEREEEKLDVDWLVKNAIDTMEIIKI